MTKLIKLSQSRYQVLCSEYGVNATGSPFDAVATLQYCGVQVEEAAAALAMLSRLNHNVADFGVRGMLTYTTNEKVA
jgi:hypothetical protein